MDSPSFPQTELGINTHTAVLDTRGMVADIHRKVFTGPGGTQARSAVVNIIEFAV